MKKHAASEPAEFPVRVTGEPTNITIYQEAHNGKARFVISYYDAACSRHRRRCSNCEKAESRGIESELTTVAQSAPDHG